MATSSPEEECKAMQDGLRAKAKATVFEKKGTTVVDLYKQARKIDLEWEKQKMQHHWDAVYYALFLYVEIATRHNLHKKTEERYAPEAKKVLDNLRKVEKRIEIASRGMLYQRQNKEKFMEMATAAAAAAATEADLKTTVTSPTATAPVAAPETTTTMSMDEMKLAVDALRLPGAKVASLSALAVVAGKPVMGTLLDGGEGSEARVVENNPVQQQQQPPLPHPQRMGMTENNEQDTTILVLKKVQGDGSCAFRSIAQSRSQGTLTLEQETNEAMELRRIVARLLVAKGEEEMVGTGMTIRQVVMMKESVSSFEAYCEGLAHSDYAGETEFWLLAEALNLRIAIFTNTEDGLVHMITYGTNEACPLICLLWQRGQRSELGNHYDALITEVG